MKPPPHPGSATLTRLLITGRVVLDGTVQLFQVIEHHVDVSWLGLRRRKRVEERSYYLRENVGWCDDNGPLSLHDPRVLMLSREAVAWRNRESLDRYTGVAH